VRRREFVALLGGAAMPWFLAAHAQQAMLDRIRRIGVLIGGGQDDPEVENYSRAFQKGLRSSGWLVGQNLLWNSALRRILKRCGLLRQNW
jgi:hypothetical protein